MMNRRPGRRAFLRTLGGAALALPFLESRMARGDGVEVPKRLVIYQTGEGTLAQRWKPQMLSGNQLALSEMLQPLSAHKAKLNVISGIGNHVSGLHTTNGHNGPGHTLLTANVIDTTGNGTFDPSIEATIPMHCLGPSIDHYLANQLGVMEPLNLAVGGSDPGEYRMFYKVKAPGDVGANPEAPLNADPVDAFQQNLGGLPSDNTTRADRFRAKRGSVLDGVTGSFATLKKSVSSADKKRLDAHLDAIADLEKNLSYIPPVECGGLTQDVPDGFTVPGYPTYGQMDVQANLMLDIMTNTLVCGARQIVTLQDTNYGDPAFEWLPVGPVEGWHAQVHNDPALGLGYSSNDDNPTLKAGFLYYASVFDRLLTKMDAIVEPNGMTLLDNSLVLWISEFGTGQSHDTMNLPVVLAGSAQGRLLTDRHLARDGATTGDLFTSILQAFDRPDTSFGYNEVAGLNSGGITGLLT